MKKATSIAGKIVLFIVGFITYSTAQNVAKTGYFMENSTHRHLMNPALTPVRGYLSFPVLGEFSLGLESNLALTNLLYPAEDGGELMTFMNPNVSANDFLSSLEPNNYFRTDIRSSIVSMGFYTGNAFWTFDVATRVNLSLNLPYDLFAFLKEGMSSEAGNLYQIRDMYVSSSVFTETSLGYSRNIMDNLRVGTKLKLLVGGAYVKVNLERMDINMTPDEWSVTTEGKLTAYGQGVTLTSDAESGAVNGVEMGTPGPGGFGAAIDLGVNYSPFKNLDLSLAAIDLGGIKWKKSSIMEATSAGQVSFSGIESFGLDSVGSQNAADQLQTIQDDLLKMAEFKQTEAATADVMQKLFPVINAGAEYSMLRNKLSLGLLYSSRFMDNERYTEITGSLNLRPASWFNLSGSYSMVHGKKETFGVALGFVPALFNLYIACDYVFYNVTPQYLPLNTTTTNLQLGLSIPLGKGKLPPRH